MLLKKVIFTCYIGASMLGATETLATPPAIPMLNTTAHKKPTKHHHKSSMPKECQMMPPMLILLPPPMQTQLTKCKNNLYLPKKEFAQSQLSKYLNKKVLVKKIEIEQGFNQLYKVTYNKSKVIYTNKTLTNFIK